VSHLGLVTLVVRDYDEALGWYAGALGFTVTDDVDQGEGRRWVVVRPPGAETGLLLARAVTAEQEDRIGDQTGGRVGLFLHSDDFAGDQARMQTMGVRFLEDTRREPYGTVAVFEDLYGNRWDLIQLV
jgi:catechol 2,3-dioxygenase-like lactoylglutathione lyase family enzyme